MKKITMVVKRSTPSDFVKKFLSKNIRNHLGLNSARNMVFCFAAIERAALARPIFDRYDTKV